MLFRSIGSVSELFCAIWQNFNAYRWGMTNGLFSDAKNAWTVLLLALALTVLVLSPVVVADERLKHHFNIPPQNADGALVALGQQAGISVLYRHDVVKSYKTESLVGEFTARAAVNQLIGNLPLTVEFNASGHLIIKGKTDLERGSKMNNKPKKNILAAMIAFILAPAASVAQTTGQQVLEHGDGQMEEVVVTGIRGSLQQALNLKRQATGVVDAISSQDISDFPGFNITEELGRLPGVAITRTNGEGQQITVRGLAAEFTRVTINGQTVTSGNEGREVDFDIFASELFGSATISKTTQASMVEGGLAATVDLRSPRPLDLGDFVFRLSGEETYSELSGETSPRISTMISKQFADGKFGIMASVAQSENYLRADVSQPWRYVDRADSGPFIYDFDGDGNIDPDFEGVVEARLPRNQLDTRERERLGVTTSIQFRPSDDLTFSLDVLHSDMSEYRERYTMDGNLQKNPEPRNRDDFEIVNGQIVKGVWNDVNQRSEQLIKDIDEKTTLLNFEVEWDFAEDWNAFFKLSHSDSYKYVKEESFLIQGTGTFGYELYGDNLFFEFGPAIDATDASNFTLAQAKRKPVNVNDEEVSFRFDLTRDFENAGILKRVKAGVYMSDRDSDLTKWEGVFSPRLLNGEVVAQGTDPDNETAIPIGEFADVLPVSDLFSGYDESTGRSTTSWIITDLDRVRDTAFFDGPTTADGQFIEAPFNAGSSWTVNEQTTSAYSEAELVFGDFLVNAGVRVVRTEQHSEGFENGQDGFVPISLDNNYTDVLPSVSVRYQASEDIVVRATANQNITRPTISKLSPGRNLDPNQKLGKSGNPELDPFRVNSYDLSVEWYFADESLLSASLFYKDLDSFIIDDSVLVVIENSELFDDEGDSINGQTFEISRPENGEGGTVTGFEFTYQQPFTFLPGALEGLGIIANYTYADSDVTTKSGTKTTLQGQSKSSYNIVGYFERDNFNVRVAYGWRDKFVKELRQGREVFWRDYGQLDVSAKYSLNDQVDITFEGINLTNESALQYDVFESRGIEYVNTGSTYRVGAQYAF